MLLNNNRPNHKIIGNNSKLLIIILVISFFIFLSCNTLFAAERIVTIRKSHDPRAIGHNLYYGHSENISKTNFSEKIDLGSDTVYVASNLQEGSTYYFAATAYDKHGNESVFSNILSYKVPENNSIITRDNWSLVYVDSEEIVGEDGRAVNAFDGNPDTIWHTEWKNSQPMHPHEIVIDLGAIYDLDSFSYLPRQDGNANGRIKDYAFYVSNNPMDWGDAAASGTFADSATEKTVLFDSRAVGQFIRLVALSEVKGKAFTSAAEINVTGSILKLPTPTLIPRDNWSLVYVDSEEIVGEDGRAVNAFDGNPDTIWHTEWKNKRPMHPHEIVIDLGATYALESFSYLPRQDGNANGRIKNYAFYVSNDPKNWGDASASGTFADSATEKTVLFGSRALGQFIRLVALNEVNGKAFTSAAEINVVGTLFTDEDTTIDSTPHIIEIGEVFVDHNWQRVDFERTFIHPIVVAKPASLNDPDPAVVRIRNVDETGFDIRIQEWDYLDDVHDFENVSYLVVEKGFYILPGGILMEAGTFEADGESFLFNPFVDAFNQIPVVIASVTSADQQNAVDGRIHNVSINGFEYLLQEQELNNQWQHGIETVSFIALESFSGVLKGLTIEVGTTGTNFNHNLDDIIYTETFLTVPYFLADMQTANGLDTCNVRYRNKDRYGVEVHISEEQSYNQDLMHIHENIGYIFMVE